MGRITNKSQLIPARQRGFTIVELLIVIVIIAILAAIVTVAYNGISRRAKESSIMATLSQVARKVEVYATDNAGTYPAGLSAVGFRDDTESTFEYTVSNTPGAASYCVTLTRYNMSYHVSTSVLTPTPGTCSGHVGGVAGPWTQISAYGYTTCGIYNGAPYCWGSGGGAIGDGGTADRNVPTAVSTSGVLSGKTVTAISAGGCVIADGAPYCWGTNVNGELGNGSNTLSNSPVVVDTSGVLSGKTVTKISASEHVCVLADGAPYCWGDNTNGKLGNGNNLNFNVPVAVDMSGVLAGKTVTDISTGGYNTCVVANGAPYCWGYNLWGALGNGTSGNTYSAIPVAVTMSGAMNGKTISSVSVGSSHVCAVATDGTGYCWGGMCSSINGTLACYGAGASSSTVPVAIATSGALSGKTLTYTSLGLNHMCAVASGEAFCWGYGRYGRIGVDEAATTFSVPIAVNTTGVLAGKTVTSVAGGQNHSCVLASGQVYCFGRNWAGEAGDGSTSSRYLPVQSVNPS